MKQPASCRGWWWNKFTKWLWKSPSNVPWNGKVKTDYQHVYSAFALYVKCLSRQMTWHANLPLYIKEFDLVSHGRHALWARFGRFKYLYHPHTCTMQTISRDLQKKITTVHRKVFLLLLMKIRYSIHQFSILVWSHGLFETNFHLTEVQCIMGKLMSSYWRKPTYWISFVFLYALYRI